MKKPSFAALLYRELLLIKKLLLAYGIGSLIFILFPVLILLSFRFGNFSISIERFYEAFEVEVRSVVLVFIDDFLHVNHLQFCNFYTYFFEEQIHQNIPFLHLILLQ